MNKYAAIGWIKHTEEDVFSEGCLLETSRTTGGHNLFHADTADDLIAQCADFAGQPDFKNIRLDSCEEAGRLDIQVYECADGTPASENELRQWREGKERLWLATYSFTLLHTYPVILSRATKERGIYAEG